MFFFQQEIKRRQQPFNDVLILFAFNRQYEYNNTFILPEIITMANVNITCRLANPLKVRAEACFLGTAKIT
jgi:hypothetical protein